VNREDVRKLIGGYATGTLTEAEQRALFAAALEDQDLFDELAGEQAFKDLLEVPGARERLLTAVAPAPKARKQSWWAWGAIAAAATAGIVLFVATRTSVPEPAIQVATVKQEPAPPPVEVDAPKGAVASPPSVALRRQEAPAPQPKQNAFGLVAPVQPADQRLGDKVAVVAPPPPVASPPAPAVLSEEVRIQGVPPQPGQQAQQPIQGQQAAAARPAPPAQSTLAQDGQRARDQVAVAPPQADTALLKTETAEVSPVTISQLQQLPLLPAGKTGGAKGGAAGKGGGGALVVTGQPANTATLRVNGIAAVPFSFTYQRAADSLRITPLAPGVLTVTATGQTLFPQNAVLSGSNVIVPLPAGTGDVTIIFAASTGAPATPAIRRDGPTGTVTEPNPTPNSRLAIIVPALP